MMMMMVSTNYVGTAKKKKGELVMTLTFTVINSVPYVAWQTSTGVRTNNIRTRSLAMA